MADELGIAARVRFLGYQQNPATTLGRAGIFVLSSRSEALPRSVLEAMRAGLPVVATRVGGVAEAVADGVNGLLAPAGEPGALAAALARLLGDADLRTRFGSEARRTYERRFGFDRMAQETEAVYRAVLSRSLQSP